MRRLLLGGTAAVALLSSSAFAGGVPEPVMTPDVIATKTSSSSGGVIVPLLLLLVVVAAVANSGGSDGGTVSASDARIKTDIAWLRMGKHGLPIYRYRYKGMPEVFEGVMAQDVANIRPDALVRWPNGLLAVDYGRLGMAMQRVA